MKKFFTVLSIVLLISIAGNNNSYSQTPTGFNTVIEYCTGTWCGYCPCGHDVIDNILLVFPETMVLGYHGPVGYGDPWDSYSAPMISLFGFNAYPTGVVGRRSGIVSRSAWNGQVINQTSNVQPSAEINISSFDYNSSTRQITATIEFTAIGTPVGEQRVNFILTEDNLVYPQVGYSQYGCNGSNTYVHDHVVKGLINGSMGEVVAFTGDNSTVIKNVNYTIPAGFVAGNCELNILFWTNGGSVSTQGDVGQTKHTPVDNPTGIHNSNIASSYELKQNYPNPFNPTTNIFFSIPKDGNVSLKFYDILGNEVASYIDNGFLKAGTYNAEFDGSKLASGVYFYTLSTNDFVDTKKMILTK